MAIHLVHSLPNASSNRPGRQLENLPVTRQPSKEPRQRAVPIWFCSRWGLPCRPCYQARGALLPHPFTLTGPEGFGGLLSAALSLGSPPPDVIRHRVSVEPGLSSRPAEQAKRPSGHLAVGYCSQIRWWVKGELVWMLF